MSAITQIHEPRQSIAFKQILIATDFSLASQRAFAYAIAIARRYGSALSVLHVILPQPRGPIPLEPLPQQLNRWKLEAKQQMEHLGKEARMNDLNPHLLIEQGLVWDVLASVIQRDSVDLLVLGTHGRSGLTKLALGSVAEEVLRRAPCPVLTIGPHVPAAGVGTVEFNRILFATDFGPASARAFPYAMSMAEQYRAKLIFLHTLASPMPTPDLGPIAYAPSARAAEEFTEWQQTMREEITRKLREMLPPHSKLAAEPEYVAETDFLPEGILNVAAAEKTELIVMGANRTPTPRVAAHIPWTLTHEVICHAKCPVLTVGD